MLFLLAIVLSGRPAPCVSHNLAIDLARVQHLYVIQPPPNVLPVVEDVVDQAICKVTGFWLDERRGMRLIISLASRRLIVSSPVH